MTYKYDINRLMEILPPVLTSISYVMKIRILK